MLEDRLGSEQTRLLHHFIEVGEYGLALEDIAGALAQDAIAITGQERENMLALARHMKMEDGLVPARSSSAPSSAASLPMTRRWLRVRSNPGFSVQQFVGEGAGPGDEVGHAGLIEMHVSDERRQQEHLHLGGLGGLEVWT